MGKRIPMDSNGYEVSTARGFTCTDASGTPKTSPYSATTTEASIVFPENAVELVITNTSQDLRIAPSSTGTASAYAIIPAGTGEVIQMGEGGAVYLKGDSATASVSFYFRTL